MRMPDLSAPTRDGQRFTAEEITWIVQGATDHSIPDYQLSAWLMAVRLRGMDREETQVLTLAMAHSGEMLDLSAIPGRKVDKHSTGGVGDKTTLVVAPLVAAAGAPVAKLSGRALGHSGGTLDKLESIPGLSVELTREAFVAQVQRIGLAVAGQSPSLVPADRVLYALRDTTATVDSIPLIASSIMSKKLAAGADRIVLDVKAGRGAFLPGLAEARELAETLVAIGQGAGRETVALLTAMEQPLGRAIGNGLEVIEAIETLHNQGPDDLVELSMALGSEMLILAERAQDARQAQALLRQALTSGAGREKFAAMVAAQGGDPRVVEDPGLMPRAPVRVEVKAGADGFIAAIDALAIALAAKALGAGRETKESRIDARVGIVLTRKRGDPVGAGEPLAILHAASTTAAQDVAPAVADAFRIGNRPHPEPLVHARIAAQ
jgi:pyrimidine-nucleoside phosphorylase